MGRDMNAKISMWIREMDSRTENLFFGCILENPGELADSVISRMRSLKIGKEKKKILIQMLDAGYELGVECNELYREGMAAAYVHQMDNSKALAVVMGRYRIVGRQKDLALDISELGYFGGRESRYGGEMSRIYKRTSRNIRA